MSLEPRIRSPSPASSGRSTPIPRSVRRTTEEGVYKSDKALRRYGATIERALNSWEISPQEWADYIAFLGRLLKAIQSHPKDAPLLPNSDDIASKLAQCLNPALPSGVHQKALEVYEYIFSTFGQEYLSNHLNDFLPGLSGVLSFASLSVRPGLYSIFEDYVIHLPLGDLRPVLKALILSLLPALEEETSEDFERAFRILQALEEAFSSPGEDYQDKTVQDGYFWQCFFLAVVTSPSKRQGSLNYLIQRLPKFGSSAKADGVQSDVTTNGSNERLSAAPETVLSPEPGLLIRCFVCGLSDPQILIQRGFLDLLVTHLPLNSPLLQSRVGKDDLDRLVSAAVQVLLRREMSLNRRLWSWFLGPDPKEGALDGESASPTARRQQSLDARSNSQFKYFSAYGRVALERCVLKMFTNNSTTVSKRAQPFRICLSLMDRWEIGGSIVPQVFLPAIESSYKYSFVASSSDSAEVIRSASLFFDGIESNLIWSNLLSLLRDAYAEDGRPGGMLLFAWIVQHFNVKEEEMLVSHIPNTAVYLLSLTRDSLLDGTRNTYDFAALDTISTLLELIPERAFASSSQGARGQKDVAPTQRDTTSVLKTLDDFYRTTEHPLSDGKLIDAWNISEALYDLLTTTMLHALKNHAMEVFGRAASLLLTLHAKSPKSEVLRQSGLLDAISETVETAIRDGESLEFSTVDSMIALLAALSAAKKQPSYITKDDILRLEPILTPQLWYYLSPRIPKYHVEAVKLIWQLQDLVTPDDCLQASLIALLRQPPGASSNDRTESSRRFSVLWDHTVPALSNSTKTVQSGKHRRGSAMLNSADAKSAVRRRTILTEPLMIVLDLLSHNGSLALEGVSRWLHSVPTLDQILEIHFAKMEDLMKSLEDTRTTELQNRTRINTELLRGLEYVIEHFLGLVRHGNRWIWQCLDETMQSRAEERDSTSGVIVLAETCARIICSDVYVLHGLQQKAMALLDALLSGPLAASLKVLELDSRLIDRLMQTLLSGDDEAQAPLLQLTTQSLKVRSLNETSSRGVDGRPRSSTNAKRASLTGSRPTQNGSSTSLNITPPSQLLHCLRLGFSSASARPHIDQWIDFLASVLPLFADAIFTNLIPLVECLCAELGRAHGELLSIAKVGGSQSAVAPDLTAMALLDALEMILARAHECLLDEHNVETLSKANPQPRSLLGNVTSGVFKAEGPPSRTTQANSRLTVILAYQDTIRESLKLWIWATHYSEAADFDKTSAATLSYNALKLRNRTRHMLEQIFELEPLESLEVVIATWCYDADQARAAAALELFHVMHGSRPKNVIPAILDALCSRTNPSALPLSRQSSQAVAIDALDIALFLSAYLQSIEDDAMDEVWADCLAFMRDVLGNPLPFRQIIPILLSTILLLAQKVDNTNFGEQRKMRRDLGDVFLRLLGATFTTMPSGYAADPAVYEPQSSGNETSNSAIGQKAMSLITVLKNVVTNIEAILDTTDRSTTAVNSISSNLISPLLHAKSFPSNMNSDALALLLQMAKKAPAAKSWKMDILDTFGDPRLLTSTAEQMEQDWFPVLHHWSLHDKERMPELLSRLTPPSSAGIMFGVGANAARLEADRRTQLTLRRLCILLLASPEDSFVVHSRLIEEKLVELFDASSSSSPSATVKAELFMLCRALVLSTSPVHLSPIWPIVNDNLQAALDSVIPNAPNSGAFTNLPLFQACKLLDLLIAVSPDEFQLHEWLYISDTIDAVYQPTDWTPVALSDQVAEALAFDAAENSTALETPTGISSSASGRCGPLIDKISISDKEDMKAMTREDFARIVLRPFLSQLSLHAYEGVYSMDTPDLGICRRNLLEDLLDLSTVVE